MVRSFTNSIKSGLAVGAVGAAGRGKVKALHWRLSLVGLVELLADADIGAENSRRFRKLCFIFSNRSQLGHTYEYPLE
jgi:hypothetical protein